MLTAYRLSSSKYAASFEFFFWLVMAQTEGATKIVFDVRNPNTLKLNSDEIMRRFHSILEPGPALAGLKSRLGTDGTDFPGLGLAGLFRGWYNSGKRFKRLQTVKPPVQCDYTVTLRQNKFLPKGKDSNVDAWRRFADDIGAVLIEDYYINPIHLHDRMALYAGAKMNFGVCNGPIALTMLTEYPVAMFVNCEAARAQQIRQGFPKDTKFPWMLDNQSWIWQDDTYDNLRRWFDQWARVTTSSQLDLRAG